jgi:hypothetical protein
MWYVSEIYINKKMLLCISLQQAIEKEAIIVFREYDTDNEKSIKLNRDMWLSHKFVENYIEKKLHISNIGGFEHDIFMCLCNQFKKIYDELEYLGGFVLNNYCKYTYKYIYSKTEPRLIYTEGDCLYLNISGIDLRPCSGSKGNFYYSNDDSTEQYSLWYILLNEPNWYTYYNDMLIVYGENSVQSYKIKCGVDKFKLLLTKFKILMT